MDNIYNYFNLPSIYSLEELNKAYKYKIEILKNLELSYLDKKILLYQYNKMYKQARNLLYKRNAIFPIKHNNLNRDLDRLENFFKFNNLMLVNNNNNNNLDKTNIKQNLFSYKEKLLSNGERLIQEIKQENNNNNIKTKKLIYKILEDGKKIIITDEYIN